MKTKKGIKIKEEQESKTESGRLFQVLRLNLDYLFLEVIKKFMLS